MSKVISSLEKTGFSTSNVMAHALLIRADSYLELGSLNNPQLALDDATRAAGINHLHGRAYRAKADAYEALGDVSHAMEAVEEWANSNSAFMSKAKNELSRLSRKCKP